MLKKLTIFIFISIIAVNVFGNGVCVQDAVNGVWLNLLESDVDVVIENQVCIVKTTQKFENNLTSEYSLKYAFPLYEDASATGLRWNISGNWYEASIAATEPDSIPGGDEMDPNLAEYLGETPLFFSWEEAIIQPDSVITVELTYVQLLPYEFGDVSFSYPNDYTLIQSDYINYYHLHLELNSFRTIEQFQLLSHSPDFIQNNGYYAELDYISYESVPDNDYELLYSLSLDELGLFSMSTYLDGEDVPDEYGNGFFTFVAEPDPDDSGTVLDKYFTLIIDRSGSMSGNKIIQARNAASFIVEHLNTGDMFNIVAFSTTSNPLENYHIPYNETNEQLALDFIDDLYASGGTNISGAFDTAVPQFQAADDSTANIIIFFTDGLATQGITGTNALLDHINQLIVSTETNINLFTFGIGEDVNPQLLTLMAAQNNGLCALLGDDELEEVITTFYLQIRNPVLLNTAISITPNNIVSEIYPDPLPNLYQGIQMIVSGRYIEPSDVTISLTGQAFGQDVNYDYELTLVDTVNEDYQFLTKLWAKAKIEHLLIEYYSLDPESNEAEEIMEEIIEISIAYGVISPFTSFTGPGVGNSEDEISQESDIVTCPYEILGNFPNPFNPTTTIRFQIKNNYSGLVLIKIYNAKGQFVDFLALEANGAGIYEILWDGKDINGNAAASGLYFFTVDFGNAILSAKMTLLK